MLQEYDEKVERRLGNLQGVSLLTWLSGAYPLALIFLALLAWGIARLHLGHAPRYWVDDPKYISDDVSFVVTAFFLVALCWMVAVPVSIFFWLIGLASRVLYREVGLWPIAISALAWGTFFVFVRWDPGSILKWLVD